MKIILPKSLLSGALAFALAAGIAVNAQTTRYQATPNSKVQIDGTSTVHDWTVNGKIIGGAIELESNYPLDPAAETLPDLKVVPKVDVSIPVSSLKSDKKRMDEVMLEAMKYPEHQKITYKLTELKPKAGARKAGDPLEFESKGEITIAGVAKPYNMAIKVEKIEGGKLKVSGSTPVKMTDHGLKPPAPALALGLIKVGDDVKVSFEWVTQQKTDTAAK